MLDIDLAAHQLYTLLRLHVIAFLRVLFYSARVPAQKLVRGFTKPVLGSPRAQTRIPVLALRGQPAQAQVIHGHLDSRPFLVL